MPVGYTPHRSVQVPGFSLLCCFAPMRRLVSASCSSGQRFASGFLRIRSRPRHPCLWLALPLVGRAEDFHLQVSAPCRAHEKDSRPDRPRRFPLSHRSGCAHPRRMTRTAHAESGREQREHEGTASCDGDSGCSLSQISRGNTGNAAQFCSLVPSILWGREQLKPLWIKAVPYVPPVPSRNTEMKSERSSRIKSVREAAVATPFPEWQRWKRPSGKDVAAPNMRAGRQVWTHREISRCRPGYLRTILEIIGPRYSAMRAENSRALSCGTTPFGGISRMLQACSNALSVSRCHCRNWLRL